MSDAAADVSPEAAEALETEYPPVNLSVPQFTARAILTGMVLGGLLSLCNVYAGLKIGWGFNMSITSAILSYGLWMGLSRAFGLRTWNLLENNVNQTAASSAASISSAGLVAPIPALTMLTGYEWSYPILVIWTFSVAVVGVVVAVGLRKQMLIVDALPFPSGIATAETLKEMYAHGAEAMKRFWMLVAGAAGASILKLLTIFKLMPKLLAFPGSVAAGASSALEAKGITTMSLKNLTFGAQTTGLMFGVGIIVGPRGGLSMLLGAILAWGIIGPMALDAGMTVPGKADPEAMWFGAMIKWMLWPGVAMMVVASLTSFAFSWRSVVAAITGTTKRAGDATDGGEDKTHDVPRRLFLAALAITLLLSVILQGTVFDIGWGVAAFGVLLTFALAIVAARVSGETAITPVGAMGKVTQLTFGAIDPANATSNLMAANVTGGAASQCADLLHDMKTGLMVGASPRFLAFAQVFGALAGAVAGCAFYMILVPNPSEMLLTEEWAAPAVAQWKAVAEVFMKGIDNLPQGAPAAILWGSIAGFVLAILEKVLPKKVATWIPSPSAMGIAFAIPAFYSVQMCLGGLTSVVVRRIAPAWSTRFLIVLAAGMIAGDTLTGVGDAIVLVLRGLGQ